ncbi:S8 family serine peptidase [Cytobacillus dafuensis]|uniref:S8 family serine peptidase n=1 Tax=Cytobacillus dafuensis TaxID=1742359 RepID=A0A5B8Z681_CYTDA|nr:S8 family serine peptidase [Cytobacillus dafuensis]QED46896.1 S8 family serine peptidase [Cytobacillus dafuensis]
MGKKANKSRIAKSLTVAALSASFILGSIGQVPLVSKATSFSKAEEVLASLTPEQRAALKQISTNEETGLQISSDVDLTSSNETTVIVEFKNKPAKVAQIVARAEGNQLSETEALKLVDQDHETFSQDVQQLTDEKNKKSDVKIHRSFKHAFNGVSISLPANQIENLLKLNAVKAVWSNETFTIDPPDQDEVNDQSDQISVTNYTPYDGLDRLHAEGFTGKGIKVGVIDTGIDYNHPDLKDAYKGGFDFVDNDSDPMETTYEDWKKSGKPELNSGRAYYTEHGTHVSGIIVGRGAADSEYKMTGAAPEADVYGYRVLGPYGSGSSEAVMAGIDRAVKDGMDVINLSLGASINDPNYPTSIAVNNAVINGVTAVIAAGNTGDKMFTLGSPGAASLALTVGASSVAFDIYQYAGAQDGKSYSLRQLARNYSDDLTQLKGKTYSLVDVGLGNPADFNGKDVTGNIAFIKRGSIGLIDKIKNAKARGAVGVIMYNDEANSAEGEIQAFLGESVDAIPAFSVSNADGEVILEDIKAGKTDFTFGDYTKVRTAEDELAGFSSRGPSRVNYEIKPEITAPGVSILSTVPFYMNNKTADGSNPEDYQYAYERLSGTSMATPYAAGISALLLQANEDLQPADIKSILMNTADPLSKDYSVFEAGSGRVDAYEAIHSSVEFVVKDKTPMNLSGKQKLIDNLTGGISFGTFGYTGKDITDSRHITVKSLTNQNKTFSVDVKFQTGLRGSKDAAKNNVTLEGPTTVKVKGNSVRDIKFDLDIPKTAERGTYEGFIVFTNNDNPTEQYQIPFGGRVVNEGIETFKIANPIYSTNKTVSLTYYPFLDAEIAIKSHMKTLDVVIHDPKTGKDLGVVGSFNTIVMDENALYKIPRLISNYYYPFTGDKKNPVSNDWKVLKPGHYVVKLVGTNENGDTFIASQDVVNEFGIPNVTTSFDSLDQKVIEYSDSQLDSQGQFLYDFNVHVEDTEMEETNSYGIPVDPSKYSVMPFYNGYPSIPIKTDKNGEYVDQILVRSQYKVLPVSFIGLDAAKNGTSEKRIAFTKNTTPYYYLKANKEAITAGETVNYSVRSNNMKNLKSAKMTLQIINTQATIENVTVDDAVKQYGDAEVTVTTSPTAYSYQTAYTFTFTYSGNNELPEDLKLFNFDMRSLEKGYTSMSQYYAENASFFDQSNVETKNIYTFNELFDVKAKVSKLVGAVNVEGAKDPVTGQSIPTIDHRTLGTKVTLSSYDGKTVMEAPEFTKGGEYTLDGIKVDPNPYTIKVDVPGHFTMYRTMDYLSDNIRGELIGKFMRDSLDRALAGDVNKDNVIDVLDAIELQKNWGTNHAASDLNFDKTVDKKDMYYIIKNYGASNPTVENAPNAKKTHKGASLDSILSQLGLK